MAFTNNKSFYNIVRSFEETAAISPDTILISVENETATYAEFVRRIHAIAGSLRNLGIRKEDKIGLILSNSVYWYAFFWAAVSIGAIPVPFDPQIGRWELSQLIDITTIKLCVITRKYRANEILEHMLELQNEHPCLQSIVLTEEHEERNGVIDLTQFENMRGPDVSSPKTINCSYSDTLMFACTSGTTGNPKIIDVEHGGFYRAEVDMARYLEMGPEDRILVGMPLYHQGGFGMGLQAILQKGSAYYLPTFLPDNFLKTIEEKRITIVQLSPTLAKILLTVPDFDKYDISSVRLAYFAGEVLPDELAKEFTERLKIRVVNIIGSTETATMLIWDSATDQAYEVNEFRTLPFTHVKILDQNEKEAPVEEVGTIFIQTSAVLKQYWGNPAETERLIRYTETKRWFNTGDLGKRQKNGRIRFMGRAKRIIKRGPNLVYPEEIEAFLLTHPAVEAVAVMTEKNEVFGETIVAHIQTSVGKNLSRGDFLKFCKGNLSSYKIPDQFILTDQIPVDIGKIQHKYLRK